MEASKLHTPPPPGNTPWYTFTRTLGGFKSLWMFNEEKNLLPLPGIEPRFLACPSHNLFTIVTKIPWLPTAAESSLYM